jgi:phosphatidate cytidylyltransferase
MFDILSQSSTRIKTGLILLGVALVVGFIDSFTLTWLMLGGLFLFALHESLKLFAIEDDSIYFYGVAVWVIAYFYPKPEDLVFVLAIVFASILAYTKEFNKKLFIPLFYPIAPFLFILSLYGSFGMESLLWLVMIVAGADVGAYYIGKQYGETQFCQTSPNKTLEGVFGGIGVAVIFGILFAIDDIGLLGVIVISILVACASIFGDLFESYLKREADVKDSGDILPGHGGILDRADGYLFGAIVMLVLLRLMA